jgi:uncharacterized membrane protein
MLIKYLHILSAILLVGNVIVTGVWAAILWKDQGVKGFAGPARAILMTDLMFTLGGSLVLVTTGVFRTYQLHLPLMGTPWIMRAMMALGVSTFLWLFLLVPDQLRMAQLIRSTDEEVAKSFRRWTWVGWGAVVPLVYAVYQMSVKPV